MIAQEFAPHPAVDLTNQDAVFLALEELAIAHMQHTWIQKNAPEHEDAAAVAEQAREFQEDLTAIFSGAVGEDRVVANGWAGMRLGAHLRRSVPALLEKTARAAGDERELEQIPDADLIGFALEAFLAGVDKVSALDAAYAAKGQKLPPKLYIDFMIAWSGLFSGAKSVLELDEKFAC